MRYPNLLLVGVQKSGTTWLHQTLSMSRHIFGSKQKELNLFGRPDYQNRLDDYRANFVDHSKPTATYFLESTPHYFHAPTVISDVASQIQETIGDVRIMVVLRNPIERYRSAYTHHMQKRRLEYTSSISILTDEQIMLATGLYGKILSHWRNIFPDMLVYSYDKLRSDRLDFLNKIFDDLGITYDLDRDAIPGPTHTSSEKRIAAGWEDTQQLTPSLRARLVDYYRDDVEKLADLVDFDVFQWLE
ncbi:MAG: sulfotransferase domain-containing protein [Pseudomonadota bacterium]